MRLVTIEVTNFRSIRNAKFTIAPYTVLLGPNNTGKSNFLHALKWSLTPGQMLGPEDLPVGVLQLNPTLVDLEFSELTPGERVKYAGNIRPNGSLVLRRQHHHANSHPLNNGYRSISNAHVEHVIPQENIQPGFLPDLFFLPALFDLKTELKLDQSSMLGRMISNSAPLIANQQTIPTAHPIDNGSEWGFGALLQSISDKLGAFGATVDVRRPVLSAMRLLEVDGVVELSDGVKTAATHKGHGLQRALVFAIAREWARRTAPNLQPAIPFNPPAAETVIFALEEPELNIHPHAVRQLIDDLTKLSIEANRQVVLCSHSPHFVDLASVESIKVVKKTDAHGTTVRECVGPLFPADGRADAVRRFNATAYFNPDRSELFFADKIVLVEGATEKKLLPFLAKLLGVFRPGVSIIDCDGKYNLRLFMAVLDRFGLPYTVVHDVDPVRGIPSSQKQTVFEENGRIANSANGNVVVTADPDFEGLAGIPKRSNKPYSAYKAFSKTKAADLEPKLAAVVKAVYAV